MSAVKYSRQREEVRRYLFSCKDHPTAEMVYHSLRDMDPHISLATVYRNLSFLSERGEIRRISAGDGPDRFDGDLTDHQHFICRCCHRVFDVFLPEIHRQFLDAVDSLPGTLDYCLVNYYGKCQDCQIPDVDE